MQSHQKLHSLHVCSNIAAHYLTCAYIFAKQRLRQNNASFMPLSDSLRGYYKYYTTLCLMHWFLIYSTNTPSPPPPPPSFTSYLLQLCIPVPHDPRKQVFVAVCQHLILHVAHTCRYLTLYQ